MATVIMNISKGSSHVLSRCDIVTLFSIHGRREIAKLSWITDLKTFQVGIGL